MAVVTNILDILSSQTCLAISDALTVWMWLAQQKWNHWLHAASGKQRSWIVFQDKRGTRHNFVSAIFEKF